MKIFISADLEGTAGVVQWDQTNANDRDYPQAVELMTGEVNAAIDGAFSAGATEVIVNDSHNTMRNLRPLELDRRAKLLSGGPKKFSMMAGIDESFDAVFFTGYHAMLGTRGVLSHTYWGSASVRVNDVAMGEYGVNGALAGRFGVPVALVTGDDYLCAQAGALLPGVTAVQTKTAHGRYAALQEHPEIVRQHIREGATKALANLSNVKPFRPESPVRMEVDFVSATQADLASRIPGTERIADRTVRYVHQDYESVFLWLLVAGTVAGKG